MTSIFQLALSLPLTDPVLKFLLILVIILFAPILLNKIRIPHLIGLIIAGAIIGPNGFYVIDRDSGIILSGTAGLLYIMFLAGLDIDLVDFRKNSGRSLVFGLYTFLIPMIMGTLTGIYLLKFSFLTSLLLASMFASHTLIAYPIVSKLGVARNRAVNITVGGTLITDTLALMVLAVIVAMTAGQIFAGFWLSFSISILLFTLIVTFGFPVVGRWFFKRFDDHVLQYIFVLAMVFLGAFLAQIAGIEAIIGAFLTGLSFNRLIPRTSPLMNRIEFVGTAIIIPFFLIGVGMLVDYRAFFVDFETIKVAVIMTILATAAKFIAAWLTQKTFKFSIDERRLIFGLSNAQAAATLAAVIIGYNVILGYTDVGEPIRLLNDSVLNGTIIMILVTCTIASFSAQKGAKNLVLKESSVTTPEDKASEERILIPLSNIHTTDELINLSLTIKSKLNKYGFYALNIINNISYNEEAERAATKLFQTASHTASAADIRLHEILRYDVNVVNGITSVVREQKITDLILGLHQMKDITDTFLGDLTEGILSKCKVTTLIYKPYQPLSTIKRHIIIIPNKAEREVGFPFWLFKVWNIARNTGKKLIFYGSDATLDYIREIHEKHPVSCEFRSFLEWDEFMIISTEIRNDDNLIAVLSQKDRLSYHVNMSKVATYLNRYFQKNSFILIYPMQVIDNDTSNFSLKNPSITESVERIDEIGKTILNLFKRK